MSTQNVLFDAPGPRARRNFAIGNAVGVLLLLTVLYLVISRLGARGQLDPALWKPLLTSRSWQYYILPGLQNTLVAGAYSIVGAMVFGLLFGVGRLSGSRAIRWFCGIVVEFFRAVPVLIMMVAGWLALNQLKLIPAEMTSLVAVVGALILYNGSVIAELVRSGIHGLPKGQREAGLAIGLTRNQSIRSIELPQALIAMLPSLVSQFVVILKDSALGYYIAYAELLRNSRLLGTDGTNILQTLFVAAAIFILINVSLSRFAEFLARRVGGATSGKTRVGDVPNTVTTIGLEQSGTAAAKRGLEHR